MSKKVKFAAEAAWDCLRAYRNDPWQYKLLGSAQACFLYKELEPEERAIWEVVIRETLDAGK